MSTDFLTCKPFRVFPAPGRDFQCEEVRRFLEKSGPSGLLGRKALLEGKFQGRDCLLRWFSHGGVLRNIFQGRYVGTKPRAVAELSLLATLKERGLPVVEPMFGLVEKMAVGYHQAIVTVRLDGAEDLSMLNKMASDGLISLVKLLERFFDVGLYHPDLNIKNILFVADSGKFFLLDFDRAVLLQGPLVPVERKHIYERLFRSFDKLGKLNLWDGFPFETLPDYVEEGLKGYQKIRKIRAFLWKLNRK